MSQFKARKVLLIIGCFVAFVGAILVGKTWGIPTAAAVTASFLVIGVGHVLRGTYGAIIAIIGTSMIVTAINVLSASQYPWWIGKYTDFTIVWFTLSLVAFFAYVLGCVLVSLADRADTIGRKD